MKVDPEYLRSHYSSLSDDFLLAIDRADLVEAAQQCYDQEVSRRGLNRRGGARKLEIPRAVREMPEEAEEVEQPPDPDEPPDWLDDAAEAFSVSELPGAEDRVAAARSALDAAGIPCHVESVETTEEESNYVPPDRRWRVVVPGNFNLEAMSVLEREFSNPEFEALWKAHLETLSDGELLETEPENVLCGLFDRVERVQRAYEEELAARGLKQGL